MNVGSASEQVDSLEAMSPGAASVGGSRNAGSGSRKSASVFAFASRNVIAGRFHFASIVARIEVWSCTTLVTPARFAYGDTTTAGTRGP